jgi:hypothetical protein
MLIVYVYRIIRGIMEFERVKCSDKNPKKLKAAALFIINDLI